MQNNTIITPIQEPIYSPTTTNPDSHIDFKDVLDELNHTEKDKYFVLGSNDRNQYACIYMPNAQKGALAVFTSEMSAFRYAEWIDVAGLGAYPVTIEEAINIANARPVVNGIKVLAIALVDNVENPKILVNL